MSDYASSPMKAIRAKCLDCVYTAQEVKMCPCTDCPLWHFRLGKNPNRKPMSEERREAAAEKMRKMHRDKVL